METLVERMTAEPVQVHITVVEICSGMLCGTQITKCSPPPCCITQMGQGKLCCSVCWLQYLSRVINCTVGRQHARLGFGAWRTGTTVTDLAVDSFIQHLAISKTHMSTGLLLILLSLSIQNHWYHWHYLVLRALLAQAKIVLRMHEIVTLALPHMHASSHSTAGEGIPCRPDYTTRHSWLTHTKRLQRHHSHSAQWSGQVGSGQYNVSFIECSGHKQAAN